MISLERCLHELAQQVRNLLGCGGANLFLGCPEGALRHPLLSRFALLYPALPLCYGSPFKLSPSACEQVYALCDLAIQTGRYHYGAIPEEAEKSAISCAVVPLERPGGLLGLLLLTDAHPDAFQPGERRLIGQYVPALARQVELELERACAPAVEISEGDVVTGVREQSEFIALVSHELRVPLTAIKGYAGLLQAYSVSDRQFQATDLVSDATTSITAARQQQYLDVIMEQANHLEVLIGDLLDISRLQSSRLALRRTWVNVESLCRRVAQLVQYRVDQQQPGAYCIRCQLDPALPLAWADPDRVQQVLMNLVENAVKYSPQGGPIDIQAETGNVPHASTLTGHAYTQHRSSISLPGEGLQVTRITVHDQGIGIPYQQQDFLFQPFTRLAHPTSERAAGAGLGLYLARKLVEAMGGEMTLKSREGSGTSVTFTLPAGAPGEGRSPRLFCASMAR
jgi:signal transduction histidine kinase